MLSNRNGSVTYLENFCFAAGTLVHTNEGLKPIEQIKVGDWVLSKHYGGEGEQAYKRVTRTIKSDEEAPISMVRYFKPPDRFFEEPQIISEFEDLFVTPNHPVYIKEVGWRRAVDVCGPLELVTYDTTLVRAYECYTLWCTPTERVALGLFGHDDIGPLVDFRNGAVEIIDECAYMDAMVGMGSLYCQPVYNIEAEDYCTYYVGELGVWVCGLK